MKILDELDRNTIDYHNKFYLLHFIGDGVVTRQQRHNQMHVWYIHADFFTACVRFCNFYCERQ